MKLIGKGLIIDLTNGLEFPDYGDLTVNFGLNVLNVPSPTVNGGYVIPYDAPVTGKISWYDVTAEVLAALTGGGLENGSVRYAQAESHQVPTSEPYEITLDNADIIPLSEVVISENGVRMRRVPTDPGESEYVISGNVLEFSLDAAGSYVYVDYFYEDTSAGKTMTVDPYSLPGEFKLLASLKFFDTYAADYTGELVFIAERCRRTGPVDVGSRAADFGTFGFDFAVENRNPGDVVVCFP
jgi:hypothetical protein